MIANKIEYKYSGQQYWLELISPSGISCERLNFTDYQIRINGVIYTKNTKEFRLAFKKEMIWMILQND